MTIRPVLAAVLWLAAVAPASGSFLERDGVRAFIDDVSSRQDFNAAELRGLFENVERQEAVLEAIAAPAEAMPWYRYRPIFITDPRIEGGIEFVRDNSDLLARAEREFGVPPEIVAAIIGVETFYGRHKGRHPVLDTLATLAFEYPPRSDFFRRELEQFLLLARDERIAPTSVKGSYAGAMGMPQFISSSYRHYAIDFDGDGRRDLWNSNADVIGSVAAYLADHGWSAGEPIVHRVRPSRDDWRELTSKSLKPRVDQSDLRAAGLGVEPPVGADERVHVFSLETEAEPEVWVGRGNFYAITRYNHSALYAMAVYQLAERIRRGVETEPAE
ncbi:lytic murein transglycosylase B [Halofilum ochraceum]|uniref:lytic murein transglycosylase B n=1 Tax=Halofilum ochraceum TaxID=1611323 RepID=UPI000830A448|nr:lytic murein transglycosylase B [Halofilum ochraceum]